MPPQDDAWESALPEVSGGSSQGDSGEESAAEPSVGEAATDAERRTAAVERKVVGAGALAASVGARKVEQAGKAATSAGAARASQVAGAVRKAATKAAEGVGRGARSVKDHFDPDGQAAPEKETVRPLHELSEEVKLAYLKALVWLTYQDDRQIDEREVAELQVLMVQVGCSSESRHTIRGLVGDPVDLDAAHDIEELKRRLQAPTERKAVTHALLKDAIRLHLATSGEASAVADDGLRRLARLLDIDEKQRTFLLDACLKQRRLFDERLSESQVKELAKDLSSKAAGVGVPIAAVYLSGSVTGLSAAGMTSGLAALGLGGVLGLSAMATGVGVAVVGGVVIYQGSRWLMDRGRRGRIHRRELLLQEALRIHQKAISNLAEDMGNLGEEMTRLLNDVGVNELRIEKLSRSLTLFREAIGALRKGESNLEQELATEASGNARNHDEDEGDDPQGS